MEFLTIQQAARRLHVSPIAVRHYIAGGYLPSLRVRGEWRIRAEMLDRSLKPAEPARQPHSPWRDPVGRPLTEDDTLWNLVGMAGPPDEPKTDVSANKHKYLAEAYADWERSDAHPVDTAGDK